MLSTLTGPLRRAFCAAGQDCRLGFIEQPRPAWNSSRDEFQAANHRGRPPPEAPRPRTALRIVYARKPGKKYGVYRKPAPQADQD
jgi:hypothetical protein